MLAMCIAHQKQCGEQEPILACLPWRLNIAGEFMPPRPYRTGHMSYGPGIPVLELDCRMNSCEDVDVLHRSAEAISKFTLIIIIFRLVAVQIRNMV